MKEYLAQHRYNISRAIAAILKEAPEGRSKALAITHLQEARNLTFAVEEMLEGTETQDDVKSIMTDCPFDNHSIRQFLSDEKARMKETALRQFYYDGTEKDTILFAQQLFSQARIHLISASLWFDPLVITNSN